MKLAAWSLVLTYCLVAPCWADDYGGFMEEVPMPPLSPQPLTGQVQQQQPGSPSPSIDPSGQVGQPPEGSCVPSAVLPIQPVRQAPVQSLPNQPGQPGGYYGPPAGAYYPNAQGGQAPNNYYAPQQNSGAPAGYANNQASPPADMPVLQGAANKSDKPGLLKRMAGGVGKALETGAGVAVPLGEEFMMYKMMNSGAGYGYPAYGGGYGYPGAYAPAYGYGPAPYGMPYGAPYGYGGYPMGVPNTGYGMFGPRMGF